MKFITQYLNKYRKQIFIIIQFLVVSLIFFKINKTVFIVIIFLVISTSIKFTKSAISLPIAYEPILFFSLVIAKYFSLLYLVIFILIMLPILDFLFGKFRQATIIATFSLLTLTIIAHFTANLILNSQLYYLLFTSIYVVYLVFIKKLFGSPIDEIILAPTSVFVTTYIYVSLFAAFLEGILG